MNHKGKKLRIKNGIKNDRRMGKAWDMSIYVECGMFVVRM